MKLLNVFTMNIRKYELNNKDDDLSLSRKYYFNDYVKFKNTKKS